MNRKILALNLALLALGGLLAWQIRQRWIQAKADEKAVLQRVAREQALLVPPPPPPVPPVAPGEYLDTVQKMLFSKDRNPNVIVDPPPPPPAPPKPPPMPALPHYYGQIRFGGPPVVILGSATGSDQKGYSAGEKVGDFKVVSFDRESITFEWNSQSLVRHLDDLKPKEASAPAPSGPPPTVGMGINPPGTQPPLQQAQTRSITSIGGSDSSSSDSAPAQFGALLTNGNYNCKPEDTTPIGTVANGFKKSTYYSMMGPTCTWEPVKK